MTAEELIEYLKTWLKVNAQEVYGSPREYVSVGYLISELNKIANMKEASSW